MNSTEWIATVVCVLLGYALVSWLSDRQARHEERMRQAFDGATETGSNESERTRTPDCEIERDQSQESWFEVLEVPPSASWEHVRSAYRQKIQQYHPDRLEGMAPELHRIAVERSQRLNAAYAEAKRVKVPGDTTG